MNNAIITLHEIDGEALVLDTDLGKRLGMARPTNIRQTVEENREELEGYGRLHEGRADMEVPMPRGGWRIQKITAFYLNEEQALLLCMFSGAEKAKEIRKQIIQVYQAWRKGHLKTATFELPNFNDPVIAARAWADQLEQKRALTAANVKLAEEVLEAVEAKDAMKESVGTYMHTVRDYVKMLDPRINLGRVAKTMVELGYYRSPSLSVYRVRRNALSEGRFMEKINPERGYCTIYATADGKELLAKLVQKSAFPLKAAYS